MSEDQTHCFFEALYREEYPQLLSFAFRRMGDWALAEDLVEQTMLTAWAKIAELMDHTQPRRWLYKTLLNLIANERQKKHYQLELQLLSEDLEYLEASLDPGLLELLPDGLSPAERALLRDRWELRLSFAQIGETRGLTEEAAKKRCHRALRHCRQLLLDHDKGGETHG